MAQKNIAHISLEIKSIGIAILLARHHNDCFESMWYSSDITTSIRVGYATAKREGDCKQEGCSVPAFKGDLWSTEAEKLKPVIETKTSLQKSFHI